MTKVNRFDLKENQQKLANVRAKLEKSPDSAMLKSAETHYKNQIRNDSLMNNIFQEIEDTQLENQKAEDAASKKQMGAINQTNKMLGLEVEFNPANNTNITE